MHAYKHILIGCLLLLSSWMGATSQLVSSDPNWLGGTDKFNTTEGNDFWLTFMNNNMFDPSNPNNKDLLFEMKVGISAREAMNVYIAFGNSAPQLVSVGAGQTVIHEIPRGNADQIYLWKSEEPGYQGVHVYATPEDKHKVFSCFLYSRVGESGGSSRDASYVLPARFLGKEYIVQTSPEDFYSSEFAIIATEDNTNIRITPTFETYAGKTGEFSITLGKGEAYLVASKQHISNEDFNVDLSGSRICSDKPIAVFNGNQQTSLPIDEASTQDFAVEQMIPLAQWGTDFYISLLDSTKANHYIITAGHQGAIVDITPYNSTTGITYTTERHQLAPGASYDPIKIRPELSELVIHSDQPITCYSYLSSAVDNPFDIGTGTAAFTVRLGDPANAMVPAWRHRVKSMNFFTHELDPQKLSGKEPPQIYKLYLIARAADKGTFKLDGKPVDASQFHSFAAEPTMSYAYLTVSKSNAYHTIESTGDGFVGMVYAVTHAQGYLYTLGFTPPLAGDSLYVTNTDEVTMSRASYDLDSLEGHGWYQRQESEWIETRLDTAIVCDSTLVKWAVETPTERPITLIDWFIYDVTDGKGLTAPIDRKTNQPASNNKQLFEHQFILPEEEEESRKQFYEYEIQAVLHRNRLLCTDTDDTDTLKTTVRVTRVYNDTVYRVVCVGDTMRFFYDSLYNQTDYSQFSPTERAATKLVGVKKGQGDKYIKPWVYQVEVGKYDTLSRHYVSQAGCDSLMTLVLYVCDTFQFFDTIHLCSNQDTLYHERTIRGRNYKSTDTVDINVPFKAQTCECQLSEFADKFRDKNGHPFKGCDSTYHLHLFVHPSHVIQFRDTMCLSPSGKATYEWPIQYGTKKKIITQDDLEWSEADQALKGVFRDSMLTRTCPECYGGQRGCDSIHELTLIMPPSYYFTEDAEWCKLHYDENKHDTVHQYFHWEGHRDGAEYVELKTSGDYYDNCHTTRYGCDSIYHIHLTYRTSTELYELTEDTLCSAKDDIFEWKDHYGNVLGTQSLDIQFPEHARCTTIYRNDDSRCDTVYAMHLTIMPSYYIVDTVLITQEEVFTWPVNNKTYGGSKTTLPYDSLITTDTTFVELHFPTAKVGTHSCDSVRLLFLRVGSVYRDVVKDFVCGNEDKFEWWETRPEYFDERGEPFIRQVITDLPEPGKWGTYEDQYETVLGFDSIFYLELYRAPNYRDTTHAVECQQRENIDPFDWPGHEGRTLYNEKGVAMPFTSIPLTEKGDFYFLDTMHTAIYGCDSLCVLHLHINRYYDESADLTTCQFEPFIWENIPGNTAPDSILDEYGHRIYSIPTDHVGDFKYTLRFHTVYDCDSAWHLNLHVDTVYREPVEITEREMCDNDTIHFLDQIIYGANSPLLPAGETGWSVPGTTARCYVFDLQDVGKTIHDCDSAIHHRITLYRTYKKEERASICQTPNHEEEPYYQWDDHGIVWDVERQIHISASAIPTKVEGNKTYTYIDSLRTTACETCQGVGGCDSIHILYLHIDSVYHIHEPGFLCDNDTMSWQGRYYRGEKFQGTASEMAKYNIVLKSDTTYIDTVEIGSRITPCDSTYYLTLRVGPTYNMIVEDSVCDNENRHIFEFFDTQGGYFRDSIPYEPHLPVPEKDTAITHYDIKEVTLTHTLKTIEGCDSVVQFTLYIKPTYHFIQGGKGCSGYAVEWHGREYAATGIYYDPHISSLGCDSIFELDFYVKPFITIPVYDIVCDNHTYYHRDTVGTQVFEETIWWPGAIRPDTVFARFKTADGLCDSIVYEYHLTVCPTYRFNAETDGICSGDTFYSAELDHAWGKFAYEFDVDTFVLPYDTVFRDTLSTIMGCDSIYNLKAHVYPAYRHIEYDTICSNETYTWHRRDELGDSILVEPLAGIHYLRDSFPTVDGCDSIYEVQLCVHASFFSEVHDTLCVDEKMFWHGIEIEHLVPREEEYFFKDERVTINGCDSVYYLYLTAADTTFEINYDSICIGDTLFVLDHQYTQAGDYKDTTLNADGCHHFIYTHLAVIPPTIPTVWAENAMCISETAFDIYYTYTNHYPIAYTLLFDSVAHEMGFEDQIDEPITEYTTPMVISVPIPYRDGDRTQYPKPDDYSIQLILDNGICRHKETDCYDDSTFTMSYPKWITEQRFGDVIAILNENYNGGYNWSEYQWYQGDSMLVGQTKPYLYIPTGLQVGEEYHVRLTREGETKDFPTCPIVIGTDPIHDDFAPTMGYLSVVPTCVVTGHPFINILSRKDGVYRIHSSAGQFIKEGIFRADVTEVEIPAVTGLYIVQLWSNDTPEEPYRAIKILVREKCENCNTSSF